MILTVTVPNLETFEAYDYGYGTVLAVRPAPCDNPNRSDWITVTVEYDYCDRYHAECQMNRFASGLYFASLDN